MSAALLTREREQDLARRWRGAGDEAALHELVLAYMRLVISTATRFRNYGLPMSDLVQEGAVGLMQAAARFEPEREVRFSTYAAWWIRSAMQDYILRNWSVVRTGTTAAQKALFFNLRRLRAKIEDGGGALDDRGRALIAQELSVNLADVEAMEIRLSGADQSLNAPIGADGEDQWQDFLADQRPTPEESVTLGARRPHPLALARPGARRAVARASRPSSRSGGCATMPARWRSSATSSASPRSACARSSTARWRSSNPPCCSAPPCPTTSPDSWTFPPPARISGVWRIVQRDRPARPS